MKTATSTATFAQQWQRWTRFEFWPYWLFYAPLYPYGLWLALRAWATTYFTAVNPGMKYGGLMGLPKWLILKQLPQELIPKTLFFEEGTPPEIILGKMAESGWVFPVIAKPNVGERGSGVEKIAHPDELAAWLPQGRGGILIQEFVEAPLELGIFYYRLPGEKQGHIPSIVVKEFLTAIGNGQATLAELVENNVRTVGRRDYLAEKFADRWHQVLPKGQTLLLEPVGNHCRGTTFLNGNHLIRPELVAVFDRIADQLHGFDYGRFDLKASSLEALYQGKGIRILEVNGVASEPAHVYDPAMPLWRAYRDVFRHAKVIWRIARANHRQGVPYSPLFPFLRDLREHLARG